MAHVTCVDSDELLGLWCEDHAGRGDFVLLMMAAPLEGAGVSLVADRRWWGALLRELNTYNARSTAPVFLVVDLDWVCSNEWGGDTPEALLAELRTLIDAPPAAPVRTVMVARSNDRLADNFPDLAQLQARG